MTLHFLGSAVMSVKTDLNDAVSGLVTDATLLFSLLHNLCVRQICTRMIIFSIFALFMESLHKISFLPTSFFFLLSSFFHLFYSLVLFLLYSTLLLFFLFDQLTDVGMSDLCWGLLGNRSIRVLNLNGNNAGPSFCTTQDALPVNGKYGMARTLHSASMCT